MNSFCLEFNPRDFEELLMNQFAIRTGYRYESRLRADLERILMLQVPQGVDISLNYIGETALHLSVKNRMPFVTKLLIDRGFDVNARTKNGKTPLMLAARYGCEESVKILLKANAKINLTDIKQQTVLQKIPFCLFSLSTIPGMIMIKLVDKCGTEEEAATKLLNAKCPLYFAVLLRNNKIMEYLLERGADVNARDRCYHTTALHVAVFHGDFKNVELLLQHGADINAEGYGKKTSIAYISSSNCELAVLQILLNRGANLTTRMSNGMMQMYKLLSEGNGEAIGLLLQAKQFDLDAKDRFGDTPLHFLASNVEADIINILQKRNMDVNAITNDKGMTMLHSAAESGCIKNVRILLEHGADVDSRNFNGCTPSLCCTWSCDQTAQHVECVELLLEYGADPQIIAFENWTPNDAGKPRNVNFIQPILAHLAMLEVTGTVLKVEISEKIDSDVQLHTCFNEHKQQITRMKKILVWESVTMFQLLTERENQLLVHLRNKELAANLEQIDYKKNQGSYLYRRLQERINCGLYKVQLKLRAVVALSNIINISYDSHPAILDKIFKPLDENDFIALARM